MIFRGCGKWEFLCVNSTLLNHLQLVLWIAYTTQTLMNCKKILVLTRKSLDPVVFVWMLLTKLGVPCTIYVTFSKYSFLSFCYILTRQIRWMQKQQVFKWRMNRNTVKKYKPTLKSTLLRQTQMYKVNIKMSPQSRTNTK